MKHLIAALCTLATFATASAQSATEDTFTPVYKYRITLTDKKGTPYSIKRPEEFLSQKSIERRRRQGLKIDKTDLPITPAYISSISATGVQVLSKSKWNNTVLVATTNPALITSIEALPCVKSTRLVATYTKPDPVPARDRHSLIKQASDNADDADTAEAGEHQNDRERLLSFLLRDTDNPTQAQLDSAGIAADMLIHSGMVRFSSQSANSNAEVVQLDPTYGVGNTQARQLNINALHDRGFRGQGMTIAVIDGGFFNADIIPMMQNINILGTKDFAKNNGSSVYEAGSHGMMVLSCMGMNQPGKFVGTAPEASFWLIDSEDSDSEQLVEEDNWAAAVEFADSVGADLINTSLGYSNFDNTADNVRYSEMDGHTHLCSNSASMLASKGIVLCNSAGNSADEPWKLITVPADADNALTVGALTPSGTNTNFSSLGNSADGRVKPDVMAMGENCAVMGTDGQFTQASGTSFASPIMCGAVACFWQANPQLTALEVVEAVRRLGNNYSTPDNVYGYGLPDFSK